ncbi:MAG: hypothetical protein LBI03_04505 [Clostridiales bacterium]|nr:hypothetical protein [Clostridiales bacterium]
MNAETNNSANEIKCVILNDKIEIRLNDKDDISISFVSDGKVLSSLSISYPSAGYADGSLYLSPSKSYLLFSYYSGQSEEAFTLFKIIDYKLETVFELPYSAGEAASYNFSQDEKFLIQSLPVSCTLWDWKYYVDEGFAEKDKKGNLFFVYGYINILDIENKKLSRHEIRVYPSKNAENFSEGNYNPFILLEMINSNTLKISMPWGNEMLKLPLKDTLIFHI